MKAVKTATSHVAQIKKNLQQLLKDGAQLKQDAQDIQTTCPELANDINSGKASDDGKKCAEAKKKNLKECYELIHGKLPAGDGEEGGNAACQCNIF